MGSYYSSNPKFYVGIDCMKCFFNILIPTPTSISIESVSV